jgi:hypothetical protein
VLTPAHVWLAQPPPGINQGVWDIVALMAISAMDTGRRFMVAVSRYALPLPPSALSLGERGAERARLYFWELLHTFAASGHLPQGHAVAPQVDHTHPYLCVEAAGATHVRVFPPGLMPATAALSSQHDRP